jgi:hypothetical protein
MQSIADTLRAETRARVLRLSIDERLEYTAGTQAAEAAAAGRRSPS